jgi:hypothetical protein
MRTRSPRKARARSTLRGHRQLITKRVANEAAVREIAEVLMRCGSIAGSRLRGRWQACKRARR